MALFSTLARPSVARVGAIIVAAVLLATSLTLGWQAALANAKPSAGRTPVTIQFLNVSDWHGQVDPLSVTGVGNVGGASVLSTYWKQDRLAYPTLTLTGGDDFGATPPISNFFEEVPAVLAQRMMGIQVNTLGNHNFDRGIDHLQQMIDLAGASTSSSAPGTPYRYVSANLKNRDANLDGVDNFTIIDVGGIKVGVVGVTNPEAPELVFPGSFGTIEPLSPYAAANRARAAAKRAGAQIVVAVIHAGVRGFDATTGQPFGELIDFANNVGGFDVIFGDHTDIEYSGVINDQLVLENRSKGRTYARTLLTVDPRNGRVIDHSVTFVTPLSSAVTPDPAIEAMLAPYRAQLAPIFNTQVGTSSRFVPRGDQCGRADGRLCESLVGNIVTDAMRLTYGADFAITNSGGLRADLTCPTTDLGSDFCPSYVPPPYPITRGQVNTVLPFGNQAATVSITGAELKAMLENGVSSMPGANGRFAQVSGLCFTYDIGAAVGSRVTSVVRQDPADGSCDGAAVDLSAAATYTIVTNDFVASGGDGYPNVASRMVTQDILDNVVAAWITANSPLTPAIQGRIVCVGATCPAITAP